MDQTIVMWIGVIVISGLGTLGHFLYDISHQSRIIGLFAAVNESIWEHIKIALTPTILWSLLDGALYGTNPNYFLAKVASLLVIAFFIPLVFYGYHHFTQKSLLPVDITIFFLAIILSQFVFYTVLNLPAQGTAVNYFATILAFIFFGCYMTLTLAPQHVPLFKDPISGKYGFTAHRHPAKELKDKK